MKIALKSLVIAVAAVALLAGCAKPPTQELAAAKAAIDAGVAMQAPVYAPEELAKVKKDLAGAEAEIKVQEEKFWKNFDNAKAMIVKVTADAEAIKAAIPARKEAAKKAAIEAEAAAKVALEEAKALLAKAPKGKGTRADIEAFAADLKGVEDAMPQVAAKIAGEDFFGASDSANSLKAKAMSVSEQINAAIEKAKPAGKKKK
ncbi:DUF4398 domain-containing protein [bacterium]|nr:MAG: DUF4398 domain-containing protein [bacterium]